MGKSMFWFFPFLLAMGCSSSDNLPNEGNSNTTAENAGSVSVATLIAGEVNRDVMTVTVAPQKVECIGVIPQQCLVVNGEYFYDDIIGFNFIQGFSYILRIKKTNAFPDLDEVPADASPYVYELVEVVEKQ